MEGQTIRILSAAPQWIIQAFVLYLSSHAHALELSKDTVRESTIERPGNSIATWNDRLSLTNTTDDTLTMEAIHFLVPQGKTAHLRIGYKVPYRPSGIVDGPVLRSGGAYRFFFDSEKRILPGERIPITGFIMETCIECPAGGGSNPESPQDTIRTYLVFETKVSRDTLVVVGTISTASSGTLLPNPPAMSPTWDGRNGSRQPCFFNSLGRSEIENQSTTNEPVIVKFRKPKEDRL